MATPVPMPQLGESVVEGTILTWLKQEGDTVEVDEPIVEISTEKVDTEIPSPVAGTLVKILVPEGETVEVGTDLCQIDESGEGGGAAEDAEDAPSKDEDKPAAKEREPEPEPEPEAAGEEDAKPQRQAAERRPAPSRPSRQEERPAASTRPPTRTADGKPGQVLSPLVRRLAREHEVDLSQVEGSGAGGRITKQDVLDYVENGGAPQAPAEAPERDAEPEAPARPAPAREAADAAAAPAKAPPATQRAAAAAGETVQLTHIRKRIAEHMVGSLQTAARAWNAVEVDMENIAKLRANVNEDFRAREGFSLTYLPFIARAVVDALQGVPILNASMSDDGNEATYHAGVNLGIAVAVDYGLIVPVLKGAEAMNVVGIARGIRSLAERARDKKLSPDEVTGSTFTITNPGPYGSFMSVPIINQPNSGILSTEGVEKRVVVVDDMIAIRHRTFMCLSWDHRLLDGSDAMQFLVRLKQNLETWDFSHEVAT